MPNIMTLTDSYKVSHYKQYPPDTEYVMSYMTARELNCEVIPFEFQAQIRKYLSGDVVTRAHMLAAKRRAKQHFGSDMFNWPGWDHIWSAHGGYLPVEIKIAPEGKPVQAQTPLMTIVNTDSKVPWLTNYLETLLVQTWYGTTVATRSREIKKIIAYYLELTGDVSSLPYKLHDFGFRGVSSVESAGIGGAAHLVNFRGSDTFGPALDFIEEFYAGDGSESSSIPAAEHSTITSWGRDGELDAFANMLEQYPTGLVAVVSDSYDIEYACKVLWGSKLRERVLNRDGVLVVRPDSGDPAETVMNVLTWLGAAFGQKRNEKGYYELPPTLRVIQGDGVNKTSIQSILSTMREKQWSANNIAFGMGGRLLQLLSRDDYSIVMKCCGIKRKNLPWQDVWKAPKSDMGKGSLPRSVILPHHISMTGIFRNGRMQDETTFKDVCERAAL
jgi:nicotinamide phosphoribosyltransferase